MTIKQLAALGQQEFDRRRNVKEVGVAAANQFVNAVLRTKGPNGVRVADSPHYGRANLYAVVLRLASEQEA